MDPTIGKRAVERDRFLAAMRRVAATVTVVTTAGPGGRLGLTVSAMSSVSADPPSLVVGIHSGSPVAAAITRNSCFAVNLLDASQVRDLGNFREAPPRNAPRSSQVLRVEPPYDRRASARCCSFHF